MVITRSVIRFIEQYPVVAVATGDLILITHWVRLTALARLGAHAVIKGILHDSPVDSLHTVH